MNRDFSYVQNRLQQAWAAALAGLKRVYPSIDVRPDRSSDIFKQDDEVEEDRLRFSITPIVFFMPERANHRERNLYVTVTGFLEFETQTPRKQLRTKDFGTKVGYFRSDKGGAEHVYGAHYDIHDDNNQVHPVFHAQISPQMDLLAPVNERYHQGWVAENKVSPILSNVRTPSAQMDVFSVIVQLCADHLISERPGPQERDGFSKLQQASSFFTCAAHRMPHPNLPPAPICYRSSHWYYCKP